MKKLSPKQFETAAHRLWNALIDVRKIDPEMPAQTLAALCAIAMHNPDRDEPLTMRDVEQKVGVASSTMSRIISRLSKMKTPTEPGLDLVEQFISPTNRRYREVRLTPAGRAFILSIFNELLQGDV